MAIAARVILGALGVLCLCGLASESLSASARLKVPREKKKTGDSVPPGVVIVIGGVGGWDILPHSARFTLPRAGLPHEIRDFVWTHGVGQVLKDLQDFRYLEEKADELAAEILQVKSHDPQRRIYLLAKSGGTGLALRAAEHLPPDALERIVLLAAAVSPAYDLRPALRATRLEIVSFYSPLDQLILNLGTRQFGTIDRHYGPSAGLKGFIVPRELDEADRALYERLIQIAWNPRMMRTGYFGGHESNGMPGFLAAEILPWLK
jgi:pimeloyl-ACP methyl ester carboxylesterase